VAPRLADPERSRAILIGTAHYDDPDLGDIPAVAANVADLAAVLNDPGLGGFRPETVLTTVDPRYDRFGKRIAQWCRDAEDVLVVYFSGHGLIADDRSLLLALSDTEVDYQEHSALPIDQLRSAIRTSDARLKVLVLDCCYSGRAADKTLSAARPEVLAQVELNGTYVLASSPGNLESLFVAGERNTVFSGELLTLLREGVADAHRLLILPVIHQHLVRRLEARNAPRPKALHSDTSADLALVRNKRYRPDPPSPEPALVPARKALRSLAEADELVRAVPTARRPVLQVEKRLAARTKDGLAPLRAAAVDPEWPILARLRFACHLAQLGDGARAASALSALGSTGNTALTAVRSLLAALADDRTWALRTVDDWNTYGLTRNYRHLDTFDPEALWGTVMAMLLSAAELPVSVRLRALTELVDLDHRAEAVSIARGMLRESGLGHDAKAAVQEFLAT